MLPALFKQGDPNCRRVLQFKKLVAASVQVDQDVDGSGYASGNDASSAINSAVATNGIAGTTVISSSTTTNGYSSTSDDDNDANLGLILGVTIPLVILRNFYLIQWWSF